LVRRMEEISERAERTMSDGVEEEEVVEEEWGGGCFAGWWWWDGVPPPLPVVPMWGRVWRSVRWGYSGPSSLLLV